MADPVKTVSEGTYASGVISSATTTILKTGPGVLASITILGGTAGAIDIFDNTAASGTKLVPTFTPPAGIFNIALNVEFRTGLTIVTAAATLIQVSYD